MKVLFQNGDIKNVSDGYARNFLFPRKLARSATGDVVKISETLKARRAQEEIKSKADAEAIAKKLEGGMVEISEGANPEGHLYGSVDAKKIIDAIKKAYHVTLSENQIDLPHHLKTIGDHAIRLRLHAATETTLTIRVLPS